MNRHDKWVNAVKKAEAAAGHSKAADLDAMRATMHKELECASREELFDMVTILSIGVFPPRGA